MASVASRGECNRWLNAECSTTARASPGSSERTRARGACSSSARPITAKTAVAPPCMIAVPKPRTIQVPMPASRSDLQEVEVLDQREAGADGEAEDRRVDEEADAVHADQRDDDQAFQQLLDDRRDVARVGAQLDAQQAQRPGIHEVARAGHGGAAGDDRDHRAQLHELVAVEIEQRRRGSTPPAAGRAALAAAGQTSWRARSALT